MTATDWRIISESDLEGEKETGGFIRAYCHLHGSDKQRSLSINAENGFGSCHACGEQVLVRELNPQAASNIERSQGRISNGEIRVKDPRYIKLACEPKRSRHCAIERWQQEEVTLLRSLQLQMSGRMHDERARAYIEGRGIRLETAIDMGLGYIPDVPLKGKYARLARWSDHIIIPVHPRGDGDQFVGRSLKYWRPGMDENEQKASLEEANVPRWLKTHANGWFNLEALDTYPHVVFVEGVFDALALIEAGLKNVVAVIGTAIDAAWLPKSLHGVTLAFDGDESGREKAAKARDHIYIKGYDVSICTPPDDGMGKDWSERYRLHGAEALAALLKDDLHCLICGAEVEYYSPEGEPYCAAHYSAA